MVEARASPIVNFHRAAQGRADRHLLRVGCELGMLVTMAAIDVHVSRGGSIVQGELRTDPSVVARCALCASDVEAAASLSGEAFACAPCLRERLDALSVARFRLRESATGSIPWGKVTG